MTERNKFLEAIRTSPDDLSLRLVFADYLEEQGDPLAEFIRVQCELEAFPNWSEEQRADDLRRRQDQLQEKHAKAWLGALTKVADVGMGFPFSFRRGLVDSVCLSAPTFLKHAAEIVHRCPALQLLVLYDVRERGDELAACPHLKEPSSLLIADWITAEDAQALAASSHLQVLRRLGIWLGGLEEEAICRALASLPSLHAFQLFQMLGGEMAARAELLNRRAEEIREVVDRVHSRSIAKVIRPYAQLYPYLGDYERNLFAGKLPQARQALVALNYAMTMEMAVFDAEGNYLQAVRRPLDGIPRPQYWNDESSVTPVLAYLMREFGFEPGLIQVKEFSTEEGLAIHLFPSHYIDFMESPDAPDPYSDGGSRHIGGMIYQ